MPDKVDRFSAWIRNLSLRGRHLCFLAFILVLSLAFLSFLIETARLSLASSTYSHLVLIPFVTIYLVYQNRKEAFSQQWTLHPVIIGGLTLLALTGLIALFNFRNISLAIGTYVLFIWAGYLFFYGARSSGKVLFPLFFLIFMVPLPNVVLERIISLLLWGSDLATNFLFTLSGVPFLSEDYYYRLPGLSIFIAPECSGIRSSTALLLTALLAAYLVLSRWWSRLLLLSSVLPLAVFKNGLRIVTLSLLSIHVDEGFMTGNLHRRGGFVFFGITLTLLGILLLILRKIENRPSRKP